MEMRSPTPELNNSNVDKPIPTPYIKIPQTNKTYLAHVVAIRDPLNFHLDIYWPDELSTRYKSTIHYDYTFVSEELGSEIQSRPAYSCHLSGVEIDHNDSSNMKEAYILISKRILRSGGWVIVSVSDIDIYRRILVNIFDVIDYKSINRELLQFISKRTNGPIAREYIRPSKNKTMFAPSFNTQKDYHIVYDSPTD